jgi:hypothetical protein
VIAAAFVWVAVTVLAPFGGYHNYRHRCG